MVAGTWTALTSISFGVYHPLWTARVDTTPLLLHCTVLKVDAKLAEAVETGNVGKVRTCIMMQQMDNHKAKWTEQREREVLFANPDSEEVRSATDSDIEAAGNETSYTPHPSNMQRRLFLEKYSSVTLEIREAWMYL